MGLVKLQPGPGLERREMSKDYDVKRVGEVTVTSFLLFLLKMNTSSSAKHSEAQYGTAGRNVSLYWWVRPATDQAQRPLGLLRDGNVESKHTKGGRGERRENKWFYQDAEIGQSPLPQQQNDIHQARNENRLS